MVEHSFVGDDPTQASDIKIGVGLEELRAMWAPAKLKFVLTDLHRHGRRRWLLRQTGWAYDQLIGLLKAFLGISDEQINTSLATEPVFLTAML